jgi:hypothetical protein
LQAPNNSNREHKKYYTSENSGQSSAFYTASNRGVSAEPEDQDPPDHFKNHEGHSAQFIKLQNLVERVKEGNDEYYWHEHIHPPPRMYYGYDNLGDGFSAFDFLSEYILY